MKDRWSAADPRPKADVSAEHVNKLIGRVLDVCIVGKRFKRRIYTAVLGYSSDSANHNDECRILAAGWPDELGQKSGSWIQPEASGGTPMVSALGGARKFLELLFEDPSLHAMFAHSIPPVILNITDGEAEELNDPIRRRAGEWSLVMREADQIWNMDTPQGLQPLLFHIHISGDSPQKICFPRVPDLLNDWGKNLFSIASPVPDSWVANARGQFDPPISPGAVGLVLNAEPKELFNFLSFASFVDTLVL